MHNRRLSNWPSLRTSALKPRLSASSHNTDARQTIERLTLSSYSACVNTESLVIKPGSAQINVNFVILGFVCCSQNCRIDWNSAALCFKSLFHIGVWPFARFVRPLSATMLCIWEIWSLCIYMYHVFPCWQKKRITKTKKKILKPTDDQKLETFLALI